MKKAVLSILSFIFLTATLSAQEAEAPPARDQGFGQTLMMIAIAILFFYLILWRPEQKKRKVLEEQRASLKKGDRVTAMGIVGTVAQIKDQTVILRMVDGSKIEMLKAAINETLAPETDENGKKVEVEKTED